LLHHLDAILRHPRYQLTREKTRRLAVPELFGLTAASLKDSVEPRKLRRCPVAIKRFPP
jgi:hypothetical protein